MSVIRTLLSAAPFPFVISLLSAIACYWAGGASLGLFICGLVLVTIIVPIVSMAEQSILNRLVATAFVVFAISIVWLFGIMHNETWVKEWLGSMFVLDAYAIALVGLVSGLRAVRCSSVVSAALSVIVGLFWLTWPIWLSRTWNGEESAPGVERLVLLHPGMAINGQVIKLGAWSEQSVAYHLTDLSQNVPYSLPSSIWPCVLLHAILGIALLLLAFWVVGRGVAVNTCPSIVQTAPSATKNSAA